MEVHQQKGVPLLTAGLILYRIVNGNREYLIVKERNRFAEWAMPKALHQTTSVNVPTTNVYCRLAGRIQVGQGESEIEGAKRETREEVGIASTDYDIYPEDFPIKFKYGANRKYKEVTCFGARLKHPDVEITLTDEHSEFQWCKFDALRGILKQRIYGAYNELDARLG